MNRRSIAVALLLAFAATGCATIVASGPDMVPVSSTPSGATVYVDNVPVGVTPTTVSLDRGGHGQIRIELDGYEPITVSQDKVFNGWFVGNLAFGGIIGIIVDVATDNVTKHTDAPVMVQLRAVDDAGQQSEPVTLQMMPNS